MVIVIIFQHGNLSDESIKAAAASSYGLVPASNHIFTKLRVKFDGTYIKQEKVTFTYKQVVNIYIVYKINL